MPDTPSFNTIAPFSERRNPAPSGQNGHKPQVVRKPKVDYQDRKITDRICYPSGGDPLSMTQFGIVKSMYTTLSQLAAKEKCLIFIRKTNPGSVLGLYKKFAIGKKLTTKGKSSEAYFTGGTIPFLARFQKKKILNTGDIKMTFDGIVVSASNKKRKELIDWVSPMFKLMDNKIIGERLYTKFVDTNNAAAKKVTLATSIDTIKNEIKTKHIQKQDASNFTGIEQIDTEATGNAIAAYVTDELLLPLINGNVVNDYDGFIQFLAEYIAWGRFAKLQDDLIKMLEIPPVPPNPIDGNKLYYTYTKVYYPAGHILNIRKGSPKHRHQMTFNNNFRDLDVYDDTIEGIKQEVNYKLPDSQFKDIKLQDHYQIHPVFGTDKKIQLVKIKKENIIRADEDDRYWKHNIPNTHINRMDIRKKYAPIDNEGYIQVKSLSILDIESKQWMIIVADYDLFALCPKMRLLKERFSVENNLDDFIPKAQGILGVLSEWEKETKEKINIEIGIDAVQHGTEINNLFNVSPLEEPLIFIQQSSQYPNCRFWLNTDSYLNLSNCKRPINENASKITKEIGFLDEAVTLKLSANDSIFLTLDFVYPFNLIWGTAKDAPENKELEFIKNYQKATPQGDTPFGVYTERLLRAELENCNKQQQKGEEIGWENLLIRYIFLTQYYKGVHNDINEAETKRIYSNAIAKILSTKQVISGKLDELSKFQKGEIELLFVTNDPVKKIADELKKYPITKEEWDTFVIDITNYKFQPRHQGSKTKYSVPNIQLAYTQFLKSYPVASRQHFPIKIDMALKEWIKNDIKPNLDATIQNQDDKCDALRNILLQINPFKTKLKILAYFLYECS